MSYLSEHYDEIFKKYSDEELLADINSFINGGGNLNKVLSHFFQRRNVQVLWEENNDFSDGMLRR